MWGWGCKKQEDWLAAVHVSSCTVTAPHFRDAQSFCSTPPTLSNYLKQGADRTSLWAHWQPLLTALSRFSCCCVKAKTAAAADRSLHGKWLEKHHCSLFFRDLTLKLSFQWASVGSLPDCHCVAENKCFTGRQHCYSKTPPKAHWFLCESTQVVTNLTESVLTESTC